MKPQLAWLAALTLATVTVGAAAGQDAAPAPDKQAAARAQAVADAEPAVGAKAAPQEQPKAARARPAAKGPARGAGKPAAVDRLELDTAQITGNRELPKVMVIVPWKRSDIGDLVGRPVNSLVDEALQPVDREEFRREIDYYGALGPDRPRAETQVTSGTPGKQPEK